MRDKTRSESFLPNFLIIGAMKSATSTLWAILREHPEIFMPRPKEIEFFSNNWELGLRWYERHFKAGRKVPRRGEASTGYTKHPYKQGVPQRIAGVIPDALLIYMVRHPIERMRSQYEHMVRAWGEQRPIERALLEDHRYLDFSKYATQVELYFEHFDRGQILLLQSEAFRRDRAGVCRRVFEFLGVSGEWMGVDEIEDEMVTSELASERPLHAVKRRSPFFRRVAQRAPRGLRRTYRKLATPKRPPRVSTAQLKKKVVVPVGLVEQLTEALQPEVARLRTYMDESFDGWGIA